MSLPGPDSRPVLMGGKPASSTPSAPGQAPKPKSRGLKPKAALVTSESTKTDDFIMDTNSSSIVSKRSVEKLYYNALDPAMKADSATGVQKEYFRFFVKKFQRRSPLINRGYWLRMKAVDSVIRRFLEDGEKGRRKIVVNLGAGYDPVPFEYLGRHPDLCEDAVFVDVDYPQLMRKKYDAIKANTPLQELLPDLEPQSAESTIVAKSSKYLAVGCDLRELDKLEQVLRNEFDMANTPASILFTAEVSVAYMTLEASDAVYKWASRFDDVRFSLLEQHLPDGRDHPFAQTMLKHFVKLRTPLHAIGTIEQMKRRFETAGWPSAGVNIRSLWELWADEKFLSSEQRAVLDTVEPFDEWEEFALFGSHYFLLVAEKSPAVPKESSATTLMGPKHSGLSSDEKFACMPLTSNPSHRRFAALIPSTSPGSTATHGGLGTRERLNNCDTYTCEENALEVAAPSLPAGLMCHTITALSSKDCLLVGGRTSPDKASAACWYRQQGTWSKVHDLPEGRYRHCALAIEDHDGHGSGILIFGGKNSRGEVLNDALFWQQSSGWTCVNVDGCPEPRFGAAMALQHDHSGKGVLTGGMRKDGTVINDYWIFEIKSIDGNMTLSFHDRSQELQEVAGPFLGRFGAALVATPESLLLIGGVAGDTFLDRRHEILDLERKVFMELESNHRPLLVGFSAVTINAGEILVLGGGATCFSFGTYWNDGCVLKLGGAQDEKTAWHLIAPASKAVVESLPVVKPSRNHKNKDGSKRSKGKCKPISILRKSIKTAADFELIRNESRPVVLTGVDIGPCSTLWTDEYLKAKIGPTRPVVVHSSPTPHMNFQAKNFSYETQPFGDFIDAASNVAHLYLRALSVEKPSEKPTNLAEDFPSIAPDFRLPEELHYVQDNMHSSPFRISGPVTMWLHYDVMANILCQVRGQKRLLLFSPTEVTKLSFPAGASGSTINPFTDAHTAQAYEAKLQPGDVLYLPPLWLHAAEPTEGLSVAVNVFFREASMAAGYAAGRDVYGNRDLAAYERGRRDVLRIAKGFEGLPSDARRFYLARLADELRELSEA